MATDTNFGVGLSRPMPGYERRAPDDVNTAPPTPTVAAPLAGKEQASRISKAHKAIAAALTAFEQDWGDISNAEVQGRVSAEGRSEFAAAAAANPITEVDRAVQLAADRAAEANSAYTAARRALTPQHDVVGALRADACWRRVSRELDSVASEQVTAATQRLIADADGPELGTLSVELGPYLRSRHLPDDWLPAALEATSPALKTAAAQRKLATQAAQIVAANGRAAKRAMSNAGNGSYKRPALIHPGKYDPDG
jgi:hypothetical protein